MKLFRTYSITLIALLSLSPVSYAQDYPKNPNNTDSTSVKLPPRTFNSDSTTVKPPIWPASLATVTVGSSDGNEQKNTTVAKFKEQIKVNAKTKTLLKYINSQKDLVNLILAYNELFPHQPIASDIGYLSQIRYRNFPNFLELKEKIGSFTWKEILVQVKAGEGNSGINGRIVQNSMDFGLSNWISNVFNRLFIRSISGVFAGAESANTDIHVIEIKRGLSYLDTIEITRQVSRSSSVLKEKRKETIVKIISSIQLLPENLQTEYQERLRSKLTFFEKASYIVGYNKTEHEIKHNGPGFYRFNRMFQWFDSPKEVQLYKYMKKNNIHEFNHLLLDHSFVISEEMNSKIVSEATFKAVVEHEYRYLEAISFDTRINLNALDGVDRFNLVIACIFGDDMAVDIFMRNLKIDPNVTSPGKFKMHIDLQSPLLAAVLTEEMLRSAVTDIHTNSFNNLPGYNRYAEVSEDKLQEILTQNLQHHRHENILNILMHDLRVKLDYIIQGSQLSETGTALELIQRRSFDKPEIKNLRAEILASRKPQHIVDNFSKHELVDPLKETKKEELANLNEFEIVKEYSKNSNPKAEFDKATQEFLNLSTILSTTDQYIRFAKLLQDYRNSEFKTPSHVFDSKIMSEAFEHLLTPYQPRLNFFQKISRLFTIKNKDVRSEALQLLVFVSSEYKDAYGDIAIRHLIASTDKSTENLIKQVLPYLGNSAQENVQFMLDARLGLDKLNAGSYEKEFLLASVRKAALEEAIRRNDINLVHHLSSDHEIQSSINDEFYRLIGAYSEGKKIVNFDMLRALRNHVSPSMIEECLVFVDDPGSNLTRTADIKNLLEGHDVSFSEARYELQTESKFISDQKIIEYLNGLNNSQRKVLNSLLFNLGLEQLQRGTSRVVNEEARQLYQKMVLVHESGSPGSKIKESYVKAFFKEIVVDYRVANGRFTVLNAILTKAVSSEVMLLGKSKATVVAVNIPSSTPEAPKEKKSLYTLILNARDWWVSHIGGPIIEYFSTEEKKRVIHVSDGTDEKNNKPKLKIMSTVLPSDDRFGESIQQNSSPKNIKFKNDQLIAHVKEENIDAIRQLLKDPDIEFATKVKALDLAISRNLSKLMPVFALDQSLHEKLFLVFDSLVAEHHSRSLLVRLKTIEALRDCLPLDQVEKIRSKHSLVHPDVKKVLGQYSEQRYKALQLDQYVYGNAVQNSNQENGIVKYLNDNETNKLKKHVWKQLNELLNIEELKRKGDPRVWEYFKEGNRIHVNFNPTQPNARITEEKVQELKKFKKWILKSFAEEIGENTTKFNSLFSKAISERVKIWGSEAGNFVDISEVILAMEKWNKNRLESFRDVLAGHGENQKSLSRSIQQVLPMLGSSQQQFVLEKYAKGDFFVFPGFDLKKAIQQLNIDINGPPLDGQIISKLPENRLVLLANHVNHNYTTFQSLTGHGSGTHTYVTIVPPFIIKWIQKLWNGTAALLTSNINQKTIRDVVVPIKTSVVAEHQVVSTGVPSIDAVDLFERFSAWNRLMLDRVQADYQNRGLFENRFSSLFPEFTAEQKEKLLRDYVRNDFFFFSNHGSSPSIDQFTKDFSFKTGDYFRAEERSENLLKVFRDINGTYRQYLSYVDNKQNEFKAPIATNVLKVMPTHLAAMEIERLLTLPVVDNTAAQIAENLAPVESVVEERIVTPVPTQNYLKNDLELIKQRRNSLRGRTLNKVLHDDAHNLNKGALSLDEISFIEKYIKSNGIYVGDVGSNTFLHEATEKGYHPKIIRMLVEHGFSMNARNAAGYTPLGLWIQSFSKTVAKPDRKDSFYQSIRLIKNEGKINFSVTPFPDRLTFAQYTAQNIPERSDRKPILRALETPDVNYTNEIIKILQQAGSTGQPLNYQKILELVQQGVDIFDSYFDRSGHEQNYSQLYRMLQILETENVPSQHLEETKDMAGKIILAAFEKNPKPEQVELRTSELRFINRLNIGFHAYAYVNDGFYTHKHDFALRSDIFYHYLMLNPDPLAKDQQILARFVYMSREMSKDKLQKCLERIFNLPEETQARIYNYFSNEINTWDNTYNRTLVNNAVYSGVDVSILRKMYKNGADFTIQNDHYEGHDADKNSVDAFGNAHHIDALVQYAYKIKDKANAKAVMEFLINEVGLSPRHKFKGEFVESFAVALREFGFSYAEIEKYTDQFHQKQFGNEENYADRRSKVIKDLKYAYEHAVLKPKDRPGTEMALKIQSALTRDQLLTESKLVSDSDIKKFINEIFADDAKRPIFERILAHLGAKHTADFSELNDPKIKKFYQEGAFTHYFDKPNTEAKKTMFVEFYKETRKNFNGRIKEEAKFSDDMKLASSAEILIFGAHFNNIERMYRQADRESKWWYKTFVEPFKTDRQNQNLVQAQEHFREVEKTIAQWRLGNWQHHYIVWQETHQGYDHNLRNDFFYETNRRAANLPDKEELLKTLEKAGYKEAHFFDMTTSMKKHYAHWVIASDYGEIWNWNLEHKNKINSMFDFAKARQAGVALSNDAGFLWACKIAGVKPEDVFNGSERIKQIRAYTEIVLAIDKLRNWNATQPVDKHIDTLDALEKFGSEIGINRNQLWQALVDSKLLQPDDILPAEKLAHIDHQNALKNKVSTRYADAKALVKALVYPKSMIHELQGEQPYKPVKLSPVHDSSIEFGPWIKEYFGKPIGDFFNDMFGMSRERVNEKFLEAAIRLDVKTMKKYLHDPRLHESSVRRAFFLQVVEAWDFVFTGQDFLFNEQSKEATYRYDQFGQRHYAGNWDLIYSGEWSKIYDVLEGDKRISVYDVETLLRSEHVKYLGEETTRKLLSHPDLLNEFVELGKNGKDTERFKNLLELYRGYPEKVIDTFDHLTSSFGAKNPNRQQMLRDLLASKIISQKQLEEVLLHRAINHPENLPKDVIEIAEQHLSKDALKNIHFMMEVINRNVDAVRLSIKKHEISKEIKQAAIRAAINIQDIVLMDELTRDFSAHEIFDYIQENKRNPAKSDVWARMNEILHLEELLQKGDRRVKVLYQLGLIAHTESSLTQDEVVNSGHKLSEDKVAKLQNLKKWILIAFSQEIGDRKKEFLDIFSEAVSKKVMIFGEDLKAPGKNELRDLCGSGKNLTRFKELLKFYYNDQKTLGEALDALTMRYADHNKTRLEMLLVLLEVSGISTETVDKVLIARAEAHPEHLPAADMMKELRPYLSSVALQNVEFVLAASKGDIRTIRTSKGVSPEIKRSALSDAINNAKYDVIHILAPEDGMSLVLKEKLLTEMTNSRYEDNFKMVDALTRYMKARDILIVLQDSKAEIMSGEMHEQLLDVVDRKNREGLSYTQHEIFDFIKENTTNPDKKDIWAQMDELLHIKELTEKGDPRVKVYLQLGIQAHRTYTLTESEMENATHAITNEKMDRLQSLKKWVLIAFAEELGENKQKFKELFSQAISKDVMIFGEPKRSIASVESEKMVLSVEQTIEFVTEWNKLVREFDVTSSEVFKSRVDQFISKYRSYYTPYKAYDATGIDDEVLRDKLNSREAIYISSPGNQNLEDFFGALKEVKPAEVTKLYNKLARRNPETLKDINRNIWTAEDALKFIMGWNDIVETSSPKSEDGKKMMSQFLAEYHFSSADRLKLWRRFGERYIFKLTPIGSRGIDSFFKKMRSVQTPAGSTTYLAHLKKRNTESVEVKSTVALSSDAKVTKQTPRIYYQGKLIEEVQFNQLLSDANNPAYNANKKTSHSNILEFMVQQIDKKPYSNLQINEYVDLILHNSKQEPVWNELLEVTGINKLWYTESSRIIMFRQFSLYVHNNGNTNLKGEGISHDKVQLLQAFREWLKISFAEEIKRNGGEERFNRVFARAISENVKIYGRDGGAVSISLDLPHPTPGDVLDDWSRQLGEAGRKVKDGVSKSWNRLREKLGIKIPRIGRRGDKPKEKKKPSILDPMETNLDTKGWTVLEMSQKKRKAAENTVRRESLVADLKTYDGYLPPSEKPTNGRPKKSTKPLDPNLVQIFEKTRDFIVNPQNRDGFIQVPTSVDITAVVAKLVEGVNGGTVTPRTLIVVPNLKVAEAIREQILDETKLGESSVVVFSDPSREIKKPVTIISQNILSQMGPNLHPDEIEMVIFKEVDRYMESMAVKYLEGPVKIGIASPIVNENEQKEITNVFKQSIISISPTQALYEKMTVPTQAFFLNVEAVDIESARKSDKSFDQEKLADLLQHEKVKQALLQSYELIKTSNSQQMIVECPSQMVAENMASSFRSEGIAANAVHEKINSIDRNELLSDFRNLNSKSNVLFVTSNMIELIRSKHVGVLVSLVPKTSAKEIERASAMPASVSGREGKLGAIVEFTYKTGKPAAGAYAEALSSSDISTFDAFKQHAFAKQLEKKNTYNTPEKIIAWRNGLPKEIRPTMFGDNGVVWDKVANQFDGPRFGYLKPIFLKAGINNIAASVFGLESLVSTNAEIKDHTPYTFRSLRLRHNSANTKDKIDSKETWNKAGLPDWDTKVKPVLITWEKSDEFVFKKIETEQDFIESTREYNEDPRTAEDKKITGSASHSKFYAIAGLPTSEQVAKFKNKETSWLVLSGNVPVEVKSPYEFRSLRLKHNANDSKNPIDTKETWNKAGFPDWDTKVKPMLVAWGKSEEFVFKKFETTKDYAEAAIEYNLDSRTLPENRIKPIWDSYKAYQYKAGMPTTDRARKDKPAEMPVSELLGTSVSDAELAKRPQQETKTTVVVKTEAAPVDPVAKFLAEIAADEVKKPVWEDFLKSLGIETTDTNDRRVKELLRRCAEAHFGGEPAPGEQSPTNEKRQLVGSVYSWVDQNFRREITRYNQQNQGKYKFAQGEKVQTPFRRLFEHIVSEEVKILGARNAQVANLQSVEELANQIREKIEKNPYSDKQIEGYKSEIEKNLKAKLAMMDLLKSLHLGPQAEGRLGVLSYTHNDLMNEEALSRFVDIQVANRKSLYQYVLYLYHHDEVDPKTRELMIKAVQNILETDFVMENQKEFKSAFEASLNQKAFEHKNRGFNQEFRRLFPDVVRIFQVIEQDNPGFETQMAAVEELGSNGVVNEAKEGISSTIPKGERSNVNYLSSQDILFSIAEQNMTKANQQTYSMDDYRKNFKVLQFIQPKELIQILVREHGLSGQEISQEATQKLIDEFFAKLERLTVEGETKKLNAWNFENPTKKIENKHSWMIYAEQAKLMPWESFMITLAREDKVNKSLSQSNIERRENDYFHKHAYYFDDLIKTAKKIAAWNRDPANKDRMITNDAKWSIHASELNVPLYVEVRRTMSRYNISIKDMVGANAETDFRDVMHKAITYYHKTNIRLDSEDSWKKHKFDADIALFERAQIIGIHNHIEVSDIFSYLSAAYDVRTEQDLAQKIFEYNGKNPNDKIQSNRGLENKFFEAGVPPKITFVLPASKFKNFFAQFIDIEEMKVKFSQINKQEGIHFLNEADLRKNKEYLAANNLPSAEELLFKLDSENKRAEFFETIAVDLHETAAQELVTKIRRGLELNPYTLKQIDDFIAENEKNGKKSGTWKELTEVLAIDKKSQMYRWAEYKAVPDQNSKAAKDRMKKIIAYNRARALFLMFGLYVHEHEDLGTRSKFKLLVALDAFIKEILPEEAARPEYRRILLKAFSPEVAIYGREKAVAASLPHPGAGSNLGDQLWELGRRANEKTWEIYNRVKQKLGNLPSKLGKLKGNHKKKKNMDAIPNNKEFWKEGFDGPQEVVFERKNTTDQKEISKPTSNQFIAVGNIDPTPTAPPVAEPDASPEINEPAPAEKIEAQYDENGFSNEPEEKEKQNELVREIEKIINPGAEPVVDPSESERHQKVALEEKVTEFKAKNNGRNPVVLKGSVWTTNDLNQAKEAYNQSAPEADKIRGFDQSWDKYASTAGLPKRSVAYRVLQSEAKNPTDLFTELKRSVQSSNIQEASVEGKKVSVADARQSANILQPESKNKEQIKAGVRSESIKPEKLPRKAKKEAKKQEEKKRMAEADLQKTLLRVQIQMAQLMANGKPTTKTLKDVKAFTTVVEYFKMNNWQMSEIDRATLRSFISGQQNAANQGVKNAQTLVNIKLMSELVDALYKDATGKSFKEEFEAMKNTQRATPDWFERQLTSKMGESGARVGSMAIKESGKFMFALLMNTVIDAFTNPTVGIKEFIALGQGTPHHLLSLATFSAFAGGASTFSKVVADRIYGNSIEAIQFQIQRSIIRGSQAYRMASMTVGMRTYLRGQIGFVVASILNGFLYDNYKDPTFWDRQARSIGSFMVASAAVKGGIYGTLKLAEALRWARTGAAAASMSPASWLVQGLILTAELYLAPRIEAFYEKSKMQAELEPAISQPYHNYIAVLSGQKNATQDCNQSDKTQVLACLQNQMLSGVQKNWQMLTQYELNKEFQKHMAEHFEWESDDVASKLVASTDNVCEAIEDATKLIRTPAITAAKALYQTDQRIIAMTPWRDIKHINERLRVLVPKNNGDAIFDTASEYMEELQENNQDFVHDMVSEYKDFNEEMTEDPKVRERYHAIEKIKSELRLNLNNCTGQLEDQVQNCKEQAKVVYQNGLAGLIQGNKQDMSSAEERVLGAKKKSGYWWIPSLPGLGMPAPIIIKKPDITFSERASASEMLNLIFQMSQGVLAVQTNGDAALEEAKNETVHLLMMMYQELVVDVWQHIYFNNDTNPYVGQDKIKEIEMFNSFMPYGYDHENKTLNRRDYVDWIRSTSRKYVMVLPNKWVSSYDDSVFARVIVDQMLEKGKIQFNLGRNNETMLKIYEGMQTYVLWALGHQVSDMTSIFYLAEHLKPEDAQKLDQAVAVYKQRGSKLLSQYECKAVEAQLANTNKVMSLQERAEYCSFRKGVGIQIFYQPSNAGAAEMQKMDANDRALYNWSKNYSTPTKLALVSPLGQMFIHEEVLKELLSQ